LIGNSDKIMVSVDWLTLVLQEIG